MPDLSPSQRFAARLDGHLKTLPTAAARRSFLDGQKQRWLDLYAQFDRRVTLGEDVGDERAIDYVETLSEITGRLAPLQEAAYA